MTKVLKGPEREYEGIQLERIDTPDHNVMRVVSQSNATSIITSEPSTSINFEEEEEEEEDINPSDYPDGGLRANGVVIGSFLGLIANFGVVNSVGAIQAYVSTHQLEGIKETSISWVFSIYMTIPLFFSVIIGPIYDYIGPTIPLVMGTILAIGGYLALSYSSTLYQFILSLSICLAFSHALCITPLIGSISHWFLVHRAKSIGIATCGGSIGGTLFPLMLRSLYVKVSYGWAIRILGLFNVICMLFSVVLVKRRFKQTLKSSGEGNSKYKSFLLNTKNLFDFKCFKEIKFSLMVAGVLLTEIALMSLLTYFASYAIAQGMNESSSYILLTVFNGVGILGRYLPGILADKLGNFNIMIMMLLGFSFSIFVLLLPFKSNIPALYVFAVFCGFFSSSILSLTPVCLGSITPVRKFGQRYGLLYCVSSTGIFFGIPIGALIIGDGDQASYRMFSLFCGLFSVAGLCCWILCRYLIVGMKLNVKI